VNALRKVERSLAVAGKNQRSPPPEDLGRFLKKYMLGVVSNINEMLQDVQGKKSMSIKRQILRSFGALVIHIGPAINNVAPQVFNAISPIADLLIKHVCRLWPLFRQRSAFLNLQKSRWGVGTPF
jgi:serine/threonine-protein kinase ATR